MNILEIKEFLNATVLTNNIPFDREIKHIVASDLMSDILNSSVSADLLLTGLANNQTIRTCDIAGISVVIFVRGKKPDNETIKLAEESGILLLSSKLSMFEACGILYSQGIKNPKEKDDRTGINPSRTV